LTLGEDAGFHHIGVVLGGATRPDEESDTEYGFAFGVDF